MRRALPRLVLWPSSSSTTTTTTMATVARLLHSSAAPQADVGLSQVAIPEQQVNFPCLDNMEERAMDGGPEPAYDKVVSGYKTYHHDQPFRFFYGGQLAQFDLAYESWGTLNANRDNVVLIHTGLSASSHAKSHAENTRQGWWEKFIGPGLSIDTNKFFVVCTNVLGSCYGSTGPSSTNPSTGKPYATTFPLLSVFDMVRAQFHLLDHLGVKHLHASVGSSLGGMQSLTAAALFPDRVGRFISISGAARSIPYSIALRYTQRRVLMNDPNYNRGYYYDGQFPFVGMKLSREIATISYRSGPEWEQRFGRRRASVGKPSFCPDFLIETYLDNQSEKFCLQYDPNSLLYISKAMDLFDLSLSSSPSSGSLGYVTAASSDSSPDTCAIPDPISSIQSATATVTAAGSALIDKMSPIGTHTDADAAMGSKDDLARGLKRVTAPALIIGVQSDLLFPVTQQREIAQILRKNGNKIVRYYELDALYGHDTFLIDVDTVGTVVKGHLEDDLKGLTAEKPSAF